jgi:hypothetical protein
VPVDGLNVRRVFETFNDDALPDVETVRLLKETQAAETSSSAIELSGPLAFCSLASLFIVIGGAIYRIFKWRMNKGYMVIVEKE